MLFIHLDPQLSHIYTTLFWSWVNNLNRCFPSLLQYKQRNQERTQHVQKISFSWSPWQMQWPGEYVESSITVCKGSHNCYQNHRGRSGPYPNFVHSFLHCSMSIKTRTNNLCNCVRKVNPQQGCPQLVILWFDNYFLH